MLRIPVSKFFKFYFWITILVKSDYAYVVKACFIIQNFYVHGT